MTDTASAYNHWEVQPRSIRLSAGEFDQRVPLSLRGDVDAPVFVSSNPEVAEIGRTVSFLYKELIEKMGGVITVQSDS